MFKKKVKKRKGFSLVEMLVVIAIIAVLVSITVPIVNAHTVKARAATNAANLRSVEGMLSTLRVERPELFYDAVTKLGSPIDELVKGSDEFIENLFTGLGWDWKKYKEDSALVQLADYKACHFKANEDGELTISGMLGSEGYTLTDVPAAVAVSAGGTTGMEVKKGTPMTIWVSENGVVATYESGGGAYTRNDFAEVAETGEFNSTASGGTTEEGAENSVRCSVLGHNISSCVCTRCGTIEHKASGNTHKCDCKGTTINVAHEDKYKTGELFETVLGKDGVCDYTDCNATCGTEGSGIAHVWNDGVCSQCQKPCDHKGCTWSLTGALGIGIGTGYHKCSICGIIQEHTNAGGTCSVCHATKKTIGWELKNG